MAEEIITDTDQPTAASTYDDKVVPTLTNDVTDEKHPQITDEAGAVAELALASGLATPEESKAVLRKIDLYILPLMSITYG